jgi:hypothetical protein
MQHIGPQPRIYIPKTYKQFNFYRTHGRIFASPLHLGDPEVLVDDGTLFKHPAILSADCLEELKEIVDHLDEQATQPQVVQHCAGYDLVRHRGVLYGVPHGAGDIDLDVPEERQRVGVPTGGTAEEIERRFQAAAAARPVEFTGWLPIYRFAGNCGQHPQFGHIEDPPEGYRFTRSSPPLRRKMLPFYKTRLGRMVTVLALAGKAFVMATRPLFAFFRSGRQVSMQARLRVVVAMLRLFFLLLRKGVKVPAILRFLQSRHLQSQLLLAPNKGLVFFTSMPFTFGQNPWIIEIEDPTTLFFPLLHNGQSYEEDVAGSSYFPIVKALLEDDQCKVILTHMKSTARMVPKLFGSDIITRKVLYAPLGVKVPARWQRHEGPEDTINLLFINSWCQFPGNFNLRGGLDILLAFDILHERYPQLRLTLRSSMPGLDPLYYQIMERTWVRLINRVMTAEEIAALYEESHIYLLPAARVHIVSLLQAMSYGLAVVGSDGWGMEEHIEHERNGLVVKGRYGKVTWADQEAGLLREDYTTTHTPDPAVVQGIVEAVSRLVEDRELRARLGRTARQDVQTRYNLQQWNKGLKAAFDRAMGVPSQPDALVNEEREQTGVPECAMPAYQGADDWRDTRRLIP